ncbi:MULTISPECIES: hypothetical protein [unclassified Methylobacterium]|uniref:hypothetical protein n=1 Tax=unclassified Methylobacterium TaxID=2615210 RepID=UPI00226AC092|nr:MULTISPECIES: hypothetical protein [unclassified Methylobacterium]
MTILTPNERLSAYLKACEDQVRDNWRRSMDTMVNIQNCYRPDSHRNNAQNVLKIYVSIITGGNFVSRG